MTSRVFDNSADMHHWRELSPPSWEKFVAVVAHLPPPGPLGVVYLYRGQADATWRLLPSFARSLPKNFPSSRITELEDAVIREFQSQAHLHIDTGALPDDDDILSWLGLMQHHSAPTRLLDWTTSVYVAAYYAVESQPERDGAIWLFHSHAVSTCMQNLSAQPLNARSPWSVFQSNESPARILHFHSSRKTPRMIAQQGGFTIATSALVDHADALAVVPHDRQIEGEQGLNREKWIIRAKLKPEFLAGLAAMNVTANALFPGVDGLGRSIREMIHRSTTCSSLLIGPDRNSDSR